MMKMDEKLIRHVGGLISSKLMKTVGIYYCPYFDDYHPRYCNTPIQSKGLIESCYYNLERYSLDYRLQTLRK